MRTLSKHRCHLRHRAYLHPAVRLPMTLPTSSASTNIGCVVLDIDKDQLLTPTAIPSRQVDPLLPVALAKIATASSTATPSHGSVLSSTPPDESAAEMDLACQLMPSKDDTSAATATRSASDAQLLPVKRKLH